MDNFWLAINYKDFEEIAYEYAQRKEPRWSWRPTKLTRDGGKDGETNIVDIKTKFGVHITKDGWYEAKYSRNCNKAISLSKIASTVLIGRNRKEQLELILIITNAYFSTQTIKEIEEALGNRVAFVFGDELKSWLLESSQKDICDRYNFIQSRKGEENIISIVDNPLVIKCNKIYNVVSTSTESLFVEEDYSLFLVLNVNLKDKFNITIDETSELIQIKPGYQLIIHSGINILKIPFVPLYEGSITGRLITLKDKFTNKRIDIYKKLSIAFNTDIQLFTKSQTETEFNLREEFKRFLHSESTTCLYLVEGAQGHGKSYMLENFLADKKDNEYLYVKFRQNNELTNNFLLIKILIFVVFGKFFSDNKLDLEDIDQIDKINEYNKGFTDYLRFIADENSILENINKLLNKRELVPYTNNPHTQILVVDDLQFLNTNQGKLFYRLLTDLETTNHRIFFICAKRDYALYNEDLNNYLTDYCSRKAYRIYISKDDVSKAIKTINHQATLPCPIMEKLNKNFFVFKKFISLLKMHKNNVVSLLQDEMVRREINGESTLSIINYKSLTKTEKQIIDIIYFFEKGVEANYIIDNYSAPIINRLLSKRVIKYNSDKDEFIPYHDIFVDLFSRIINYDSKHVYKYALYQKDKGCIVEYLGILGCFHTEFIINKKYFISQISEYHQSQKYYNVFYILSRFFSLQNNIGVIGNKYEKALLMYYYAFSTFNVGDSDGQDMFYKAFSFLEGERNEQEESLAHLILSEIANCDYWRLNFKSIYDKYKVITSYFYSKKQYSKEDWSAYCTISNRYMNAHFLTDNPDMAKKIYNETISWLTKFNNEIMGINIRINYNIFNFENDPHGSYQNLKEIRDNQMNLPTKTKFIIEIHYNKISCLLNKRRIIDLEEIIKWGQRNSLNYNSKVARLQLAICCALKEDFDKLEESINSVVDLRNFPNFTLGIYYNLRALVLFNNKDHEGALECLAEQGKSFINLGHSFTQKIIHNKKIIKMHPHRFEVQNNLSETNSLPVFLIETRF